MRVHIKDYRVHEGEEVDLKKRPTIVDPVYHSKSGYQEILAKHVETLSALQQLHYASSRHAVLLIFQAMDAASLVQTGTVIGLGTGSTWTPKAG